MTEEIDLIVVCYIY